MVALVDAEDDDHVVAARGGGDRLRHRTRHDDRVLIKSQMLAAGERRRQHEREIGIPGHEGLGEHDQRRALPRRFGDGGEHALQRARAALEVGRDLHRGRPDDPLFTHRGLLCGRGRRPRPFRR